MHEKTGAARPLRDAGERQLQRTALRLLLIGMAAGLMVSALHAMQPSPRSVDRIIPPLLTVLFALLAWRQWRSPERVSSTLWTAWAIVLVGLATPAWLYVYWALHGPATLVGTLPPIGPAYIPMVLVMVMYAPPRRALIGSIVAWLAVAAPVIGYLLLHPDELASPRGLDLAVGLGPVALMLPMLIPLVVGVEQGFDRLRLQGERWHTAAERDDLVGLMNRRAGRHRLTSLLAQQQPAALVMFDVDHFKRINDALGHPVGDAVLVEIARRCSALLRSDAIFARWGGEEFLLVLPDADAAIGRAVAERLRAAICGAPMPPAGAVSASFGMTAVRRGDTLAQLLQRADAALYAAKAAGRNRVVEH